MRLIITDTNVLFDVIKIGVLPEFLSLDLDICTTVFVIEEIKPSPQRELVEMFIRAKKLTVFEFSGEEIEVKSDTVMANFKKHLVIGFAGYSSHLVLDMGTPKSLPLLGA